jgi:hypothetical protein
MVRHATMQIRALTRHCHFEPHGYIHAMMRLPAHVNSAIAFSLKTAVSLAMTASVFGAASFALVINFDDAKPGGPPPGWTPALTGKGAHRWTIEKDASAPTRPNVLKQSAEGAFPICIKNEPRLKDGFVEVKFKPVSGKEDQAGGVIWRVQDENNYYVCRANALEDNVVLYKTVNGKRSSLDIVGRKGGYGVKQKVTSAAWHTLRVEFAGPQFKVTFDGKHMFDVEDTTFADTGQVGVWTKDDSVTLFDDFSFGSR